jgi:N-acetylglucosaminyl-diphospho-decaprenol L-rhamnosyltransferase
MDRMDLSIVIVNWNSIEFTKQCIESIAAHLSGPTYEIVVVDNASSDDSCSVIRKLFPSTKLICSKQNLGFARANNLGVDHASGQLILFLNPDTLVQDDAIAKMARALTKDQNLGVIGCTLLNGDLSVQTTSIQPFPTIANQLLGLDWLKRQFPSMRVLGIRELYMDLGDKVAEVEVISGACLMIKREVFAQVGGFSVEYFMYAEEADLCYKVRKIGFKIGYLQAAKIIHFGGQSTNKREDGFADLVMRESLFRFCKKFYGTPYALLYRTVLLLSGSGRLLLMLPLLLLPSRHDQIGRAFRKWRRITAWSLTLQSGGVSSK